MIGREIFKPKWAQRGLEKRSGVSRKGAILILTLGSVILALGTQSRPEAQPQAAPEELKNVAFAGVRSSRYGVKPFPEPETWEKVIETMRGYFPGSTPCAIWVVGKFKHPATCLLLFPSEGKTFLHVEFEGPDQNERFLSRFDHAGIKVFLQVESAAADMPTLIDLVLGRYNQHPCVIGFGVDVEWYRKADKPGWAIPVDDETARQWEARVKSHNPAYRLFLKHWNPRRMPETYRGDIIFVDDSQELKGLEAMVNEFQSLWADRFYPNPVIFQIGYNSDRLWWQKLKNPPQTIGRAIARRVKQSCGFIWVDFSLREAFNLPAEARENALSPPSGGVDFWN